MRLPTTIRAPRRAPLLQVVKSAVATIAAWLVAGWLVQGPPPVFAAIAALLVVQPSLNQSLTRAAERSVGVILGVLIASALGIAFGSSVWVVLGAAAVAIVAAWALRMTPTTSNQVAISAILVLALGTATPGYAVDRILETLIGAAIGFVVNLAIVPPVAIGPARARVDALGDELAAAMERLADALQETRTHAQLEELLLQARLLRPMVAGATDALGDADESLTFNPLGRRHRDELARTRATLDALSPIVTQLIGMTRAVYDRYDPSVAAEPAVRAIADQLRRAAHDTRVRAGDTAREMADEPPALTRPLQVTAPSPEHWVLIGSLLVDLHRIHESLGERD